ncbi:hypothetical protein B0H11DRAFT_1946800 [Mycena galericulata]|nr:hypothetical protein B0H11DRAFT_1946800 [Mycena galericulata]
MSRNRVPANLEPGFVHYRPHVVAGQPQVPSGGYHYPPPPTGHDPFHSPPDGIDALAQKITNSMTQIIAASQAQSEARMNRFENNIQRISNEISSGRQEGRTYVAQIAEILQTSHAIQLARLQRLENILGMGADIADEKTLLHRFDLLSFAVEDLLERVKDPEANLPDGPLHHDMATSPVKRGYADAVIPPKTPSPRPRTSSTAVGTSPETDILSDNFPSFSTLVADESVPNKQVDDDPFVEREIPKTNFAGASPVTRPLVPADWQDQSPSPSPPMTFSPDQSRGGMEPYSALPNQPPPPDGTVASLRYASLGDRFAGPLSSTPRRATSVHPVSPALSVSPPQSPQQNIPFPLDSSDDRDTLTPDCSDMPPPARKSSVAAKVISPASPSPSRSPTVEFEPPQSPSAESVREELSVQDMMARAQSDTHSNIASPPSLTSQVVVPSSVTPSPLLGAKMQRTSPPRLTLSIPHYPATPPCPQTSPVRPSTLQNPTDLFDGFMSPLSPSTASPVSAGPSAAQRAPSPPPVVRVPKSEATELGAAPHRPRTSGLRLLSGGQTSVPAPALGGVKKRKAKLQEPESEMQERPLKRGRPKKDPLAVTVKQEKGRKRKKADALVVWPAMTPEGETVAEFVGKFIGCDTCNRWFHYSCLGIVPGDPRIDGDYICPFCTAGHSPPPKQDHLAEDEQSQCSRPDCPVHDQFFEAKGVFGRHTKLHSTYGRVTQWLVFWKGYGWSDATWEPTPPTKEAVKEFTARATAEGFDLDGEDCIILAEAAESGAKNPDA